MSACKLCPPGQYQGSIGSVDCMLCDENSFSSTPGATACQACPDILDLYEQTGTFYTTGKYNLYVGATSCEFYPQVSCTSASDCAYNGCERYGGIWGCNGVETYDQEQIYTDRYYGGPNVQASGICITEILYSWGTQPCFCKSEECNMGQYRDSTCTCVPCLPGHWCYSYVSNQAPYMRPCSPGEYQPWPQMAWCFYCEEGYYMEDFRATACLQCASPYTSLEGSISCAFDCGVGQYATSTLATACFSCSSGSYTNQRLSTTCLLCNKGMFSNVTVQASACTQCSAG
jgi:hypothetical protein